MLRQVLIRENITEPVSRSTLNDYSKQSSYLLSRAPVGNHDICSVWAEIKKYFDERFSFVLIYTLMLLVTCYLKWWSSIGRLPRWIAMAQLLSSRRFGNMVINETPCSLWVDFDVTSVFSYTVILLVFDTCLLYSFILCYISYSDYLVIYTIYCSIVENCDYLQVNLRKDAA